MQINGKVTHVRHVGNASFLQWVDEVLSRTHWSKDKGVSRIKKGP